MIGLVLAAGAGSRLGALTEDVPKTLLPVDGERTILDVALGNLRRAGLDDAVVVTGFAAERLQERVPELERRHGVRLHLVFNPKALEWNNAYSLWCARDALREGVVLVNGDTVHPFAVEERLLAARGPGVLLAVDDQGELGEEQMKVQLAQDGRVERITKQMDPARAGGEYIGVALIEPAAAEPLADALEATWRRDPSLYYEDGFQELIERGAPVGVAPIGDVGWVEVYDETDLARARELACRC